LCVFSFLIHHIHEDRILYFSSHDVSHNGKQVNVGSTLAYVSQSSWIQSGTVQDNILFGKPMDKTRYEKAIKACALDKDIDDFSHGDLTEIGQRGINMSGGQKQRIQLARAVYSDADIYLLDDPFSAVDAHTAAILFNVSITFFIPITANKIIDLILVYQTNCIYDITGLCHDCFKRQNSHSSYSSSGVSLRSRYYLGKVFHSDVHYIPSEHN
jgi:ABC-type branched-subunit amino acid transport system ATPase component